MKHSWYMSFCPVPSEFRFRSSRAGSLRVSYSASKEGWSSTQEREKRRRMRTVRVCPHHCFNVKHAYYTNRIPTETVYAAVLWPLLSQMTGVCTVSVEKWMWRDT